MGLWRIVDEKIAVTLIDLGQPILNEFYKKGCQEKSSASTGGREGFGLEIQPTAVSVPPDSLERFCSGLFAIRVVHLLMVTTPIESGNLASESWCLQCPPWFYRRLEAYRYFW
jgi:hypothetical protein